MNKFTIEFRFNCHNGECVCVSETLQNHCMNVATNVFTVEVETECWTMDGKNEHHSNQMASILDNVECVLGIEATLRQWTRARILL